MGPGLQTAIGFTAVGNKMDVDDTAGVVDLIDDTPVSDANPPEARSASEFYTTHGARVGRQAEQNAVHLCQNAGRQLFQVAFESRPEVDAVVHLSPSSRRSSE